MGTVWQSVTIWHRQGDTFSYAGVVTLPGVVTWGASAALWNPAVTYNCYTAFGDLDLDRAERALRDKKRLFYFVVCHRL